MNAIVSQLLADYDKDHALERCGLVLKDDTILELDNVHDKPEDGFKIPSSALVEHEDNLAATWHTHPNQTANLSEADYFGFAQWPHICHYIVGTDGVRCFQVDGPLMVELDL